MAAPARWGQWVGGLQSVCTYYLLSICYQASLSGEESYIGCGAHITPPRQPMTKNPAPESLDKHAPKRPSTRVAAKPPHLRYENEAPEKQGGSGGSTEPC